ncbi:C-C motif chemokine 19-like [Pempheris klunzingeri]|uniref:C-C motif chemokine 19-like n=1 Tax=Pempheris klunzingeri TaxID=3127111 RepID=UPI003980C5E5
MAPQLFFCLLFLTCCCTVTLAQMPFDCCLSVKNKEVNKHAIVDYYSQVSGQGCSVDAMILVTRSSRNLCVPPEESWVRAVVAHVNRLREWCKKNNYKGNRCKDVKRI